MQVVPQQETVDAKNIKVSVLVTTYNQEAYIAQSINSALDQETNFDYEIVIGDDASADRTPQILLELQKAHPEKIHLLLREKNMGWKGKYNFLSALKVCRGQYVAVLDGDDYWTSPHKLQRQVDFLDNHADFAMCFHDVLIQRASSPGELERMCSPEQKEISTLEDLATTTFIPPSTIMFRNHLFAEFPKRFYKLLNGDWFLYMLNAEHGNVRYINEVMAIYRVHDEGVWSKLSYMQHLEEHIKTYKAIDAHLKFKYSHLISPKIKALRDRLLSEYRQQARSCLDQYHKLVRAGELTKGFQFLLEAIRSSPREVLRPRRLAAVFKNGFLGALRLNNNSNGA